MLFSFFLINSTISFKTLNNCFKILNYNKINEALILFRFGYCKSLSFDAVEAF